MEIDAAPEIHTFPSDDIAFRATVEEMAQRYPPATPDELAMRLRRAFPGVIVRDRTQFAALSNDHRAVWYAFRDGETPARDAANH